MGIPDIRKIHIIGGGTVFHVQNHLALCAPAYGSTAKRLHELFAARFDKMDVQLHLTKMAGTHPAKSMWQGETNDDVEALLERIIDDQATKIVVMNAALCDFTATLSHRAEIGKYAGRLNSRGDLPSIELKAADKLVKKIRETRKDILLIAFKTTCGLDEDAQYRAGLELLKSSSCNIVVANDTASRINMIITPEEARYTITCDRDAVLTSLVEMAFYRSHLTFTRSTVVDGSPVPWSDDRVPETLRRVVEHCINNGAYKKFRNSTVGHFACKIDDSTFLSSIRKTDLNDIAVNGLVLVKSSGPDSVIAHGAKPSVGGQSQRIVFSDNPELDCIVHFHCPMKPGSVVPVRQQFMYECGSHECGENTSAGLTKFGDLKAVYLDNHGPNIVFHHSIDPNAVIDFIDKNFDLSSKTGGLVS